MVDTSPMYDQHERAQVVVKRRAVLPHQDMDLEESEDSNSSKKHLVLEPQHPHLLGWHKQRVKTIPR